MFIRVREALEETIEPEGPLGRALTETERKQGE